MKRKYLTKTYLRDVKKYIIKFDYTNDDYIVCIKKMIDCKEFVALEGHKLIDNGYYMVEIMPKEGNYTMRAYLNDKKEVQEYYFDIVSEKGIDEATNTPFYDDLYLDVVVAKRGILVYDRDELDQAHKGKIVSDELYEMAIKESENLLKELKEGTNKYANMDLKKLIEG